MFYAPMSNVREEWMVGTIKKSFSKMVAVEGEDWEVFWGMSYSDTTGVL